MLIPHIVRAQDVFDSNTRAIDVGTANAISLHRSSSLRRRTSSRTCRPQARPVRRSRRRRNPPADQSAASAPAGSALVSFDPPSLNQAVGSTFTVNVNLAGGQNVYSVPLQILYNPKVLQLLNVSNGPIAGAGWPGSGAGSSRRQHDGNLAAHGFAASRKHRHHRRRAGVHADLPGEVGRDRRR